MGKKQHSKDRMFITSTEWATEWGGAKSKDTGAPFKRLPFYCCSLTFTPFEDPVCTADGNVFEMMNIVAYIKKFGKHPVTGLPLKVENLIPLIFHKNSDGEFQCPVLNKVFTEFTHIVAVKTTGNVFCYEAIKELNIKTKNWKELLTDELFTRDDLITIQNPNALDSKVLVEFDHVKKGIKLDEEDLKKMKEDPTYNINISGDLKQMINDLGTENAKTAFLQGGGGLKAQKERTAALALAKSKSKNPIPDSKSGNPNPGFSVVDAASASVFGRSAASAKMGDDVKTKARIALHMAGDRTPVNAKMVQSRYTTGLASRSFTSTAFTPATKNEFEYIKVEKNPKKKGYVQLHTTHGDLNIELHCDMAPRACENFITHCENGYYNGVIFHRSIRNFMIQGGDPTGTGKGGQSIWNKQFKDEFNSKLTHSGRGILSLANSGPHTNGSQFFILYKSAPHLNFKHTVFGNVVGGMNTLGTMEKVKTDDDDRPLLRHHLTDGRALLNKIEEEEIKITGVTVFVNPYTEPDEEEERQKAEEEKKKCAPVADVSLGSWMSNTGQVASASKGGGVGKYLKSKNSSKSEVSNGDVAADKSSKKRKVNDFSGW